MRIAYITTYQGPSLLKKRPIVRNRSLSNAVKIELIASCLRAKAHDVEVISQGEVVDPSFTFYPAFSECEKFHPDIPIHYASALPIRRLNGAWSAMRTLQLFKSLHYASPFDIVIIFNLKQPQVACANHAIRHLNLPVILEYEDDRFVNVFGSRTDGWFSRYQERPSQRLLASVSGCVAVSPYLLSQLPERTPKMLLRGVVGDDLLTASALSIGIKRNIILFSGTHIESNGVAELIAAWRMGRVPGWELHITGYGALTNSLRQMTENVPGIFFHGLVSRRKLLELMCSAKICINPHAVSQTAGNVFAFKIIEYLAAGAHCVTTRMGTLESNIEAGITYIPDNRPETIAAALRKVIEDHRYDRLAMQATRKMYARESVSTSLDNFLGQVLRGKCESTSGTVERNTVHTLD